MNKVGYIESWGDVTFTDAARNGYNVLIMAFATIDGSAVNIFNGIFAPSPTPELLKSDILAAKNLGAKVLFSVGGQNNTYNPGVSSAKEVASSIMTFSNEYGFEGIDFDLEIDTNGLYLLNLCQELKALNNSFIITAAPQVNQSEHNTDLLIVSTGTFNPYKEAIEVGLFDELYIQAYNNGWPSLNGFTQLNVEFISEAFNNLKRIIPENTKIIIGEPASINAAGSISVYHGPDGGDTVFQKIDSQYKKIERDPQFGGFMAWDINWDMKNSYLFIKNVLPSKI